MAEPLKKLDVTPILRKEGELKSVSFVEENGMLWKEPEYQAYQILRFAFSLVPVVAGLDKFFDVLVNWDTYLAPPIQRIVGLDAHTFMIVAGVIEIIAGLGVALKPKVFGYIVSAWLVGIIVNLILNGEYFDIALRDLGLCLGALALARLSTRFDSRLRSF